MMSSTVQCRTAHFINEQSTGVFQSELPEQSAGCRHSTPVHAAFLSGGFSGCTCLGYMPSIAETLNMRQSGSGSNCCKPKSLRPSELYSASQIRLE